MPLEVIMPTLFAVAFVLLGFGWARAYYLDELERNEELIKTLMDRSAMRWAKTVRPEMITKYFNN